MQVCEHPSPAPAAIVPHTVGSESVWSSFHGMFQESNCQLLSGSCIAGPVLPCLQSAACNVVPGLFQLHQGPVELYTLVGRDGGRRFGVYCQQVCVETVLVGEMADLGAS